jgi:predicted RNA-binding Zn-ribbon protein involved in translation (DUF1610 family)
MSASDQPIVLLPCPFCGIREAYKTRIDRPGGKQDVVYVCDNCGAHGPNESEFHREGSAWNWRDPTPEYVASLEAASELLECLRDVMSCGIRKLDDRIGYDELQIDRDTQEQAKALLLKYGQ